MSRQLSDKMKFENGDVLEIECKSIDWGCSLKDKEGNVIKKFTSDDANKFAKMFNRWFSGKPLLLKDDLFMTTNEWKFW